MQSLYTAVTGVQAQDTRITAVANNLANANTTGFKSQRVNFSDLFYRQVKPVGVNALGTDARIPHGIQLGTGVRVESTARNFTDGALEQTGRPLDVAILDGPGFFAVELFDGQTGYTRSGAFEINAEGEIVDANGNRLQPLITIPATVKDIEVSADGTVSGLLPGQVQRTEFGQITTSTFVNKGGLQAIGDNLFLESIQSGPPNTGVPGDNGRGQLVGRALESSNVQLVREMVDMIQAQRAYEINSQVIQTSNEMMQTIGTIRR